MKEFDEDCETEKEGEKMTLAEHEAQLKESLAECNVAENLREGLILYFTRGIPPGSFLVACLENDLKGALGWASTQTWDYVHNVMMFLYWHVPANSWGSSEKVNSFINSLRDSVWWR